MRYSGATYVLTHFRSWGRRLLPVYMRHVDDPAEGKTRIVKVANKGNAVVKPCEHSASVPEPFWTGSSDSHDAILAACFKAKRGRFAMALYGIYAKKLAVQPQALADDLQSLEVSVHYGIEGNAVIMINSGWEGTQERTVEVLHFGPEAEVAGALDRFDAYAGLYGFAMTDGPLYHPFGGVVPAGPGRFG
jgi:hypothetical protein